METYKLKIKEFSGEEHTYSSTREHQFTDDEKFLSWFSGDGNTQIFFSAMNIKSFSVQKN